MKKIRTITILLCTLIPLMTWGQTGSVRYKKANTSTRFEQRNIEIDGATYKLYSPTEAGIVGIPRSTKGSFTIPENISYNGRQYKVTSIVSSAFRNCSDLTSLKIPDCVTTIGDYAFENSGLTEIKLPSNNTKIYPNAFKGCHEINHPVVLGTTFLYLPLKYPEQSYTIPEGVTQIIEGAFNDCRFVKEVTLPSSMASISKNSFNGCKHLKKINIPNSVKTIEFHAFYGCEGLTSFVIPDGVTTIEHNAFGRCHGINSFIIPNSVHKIEDQAFVQCETLSEFVLPNSVTQISGPILFDCRNIQSIVYNKKFFVRLPMTYKGNYTIPNGITTICDWAFSKTKELTTIHIPNTVKSIGDYAFSNSGITEIDIPESVTEFGEEPFAFCSNLSKVVMPANLAKGKKLERTFTYCKKLNKVTLKYPNGTTKDVILGEH